MGGDVENSLISIHLFFWIMRAKVVINYIVLNRPIKTIILYSGSRCDKIRASAQMITTNLTNAPN